MKTIFFLWKDAPNYAVHIIKYIIDNSNYQIKLLTNIKKKDLSTFNKILKNNVINLRNKTYKNWRGLKLNDPNILFVSGWRYKEFDKIIQHSKASNTKIVSMIDNNKKNNFRQFVGKYIFKFLYEKNFDAYWVPGESSSKLLISYGINKKSIFKNLYSINRKIFKSNVSINLRENNFMYVGQMIDRKNIQLLINLFKKIFNNYQNTKLYIITNKSNSKLIPNEYKKNFIIKENLKPKKINYYLNKVKYFIFLSKEDHWPLAVMEALCSGNILLLSKKIGNFNELKNTDNLFFNKLTTKDIYSKMLNYIKRNTINFNNISKSNISFSNKFALKNSLDSFRSIIKFINEK